jgi:hypothetical protein
MIDREHASLRSKNGSTATSALRLSSFNSKQALAAEPYPFGATPGSNQLPAISAVDKRGPWQDDGAIISRSLALLFDLPQPVGFVWSCFDVQEGS